MTELPFTEAEVLRAIHREGYSHPVLDVMDRYEPQLREFVKSVKSVGNAQEQQGYIKQNYGFFADAVEQLGEFGMSPLEIIAIWSRRREIGLPGYDTALVLTAAYGCAPIEGKIWDGFPRKFLEQDNYPDDVYADAGGMALFASRIEEASGAIDKIDHFYHGIPNKEYHEMLRNLSDPKVRDALQPCIDRDKDLMSRHPEMELIPMIGEQFVNGTRMLFYMLDPKWREVMMKSEDQ